MPPTAPRPVFVIGSFVMACCWFTHRLPARGEHQHAQGFLMEPGGKGLNVAVALRRLGTPVHLLLGVGSDPAADALHALLRREGLPEAHVHRFSGPSGHGAGLIDDAGDNVIVVHPGANHRLGREHALAAAQDIAASAVLYGQFEAPDDVLAQAFQLGRQAGAHTVLNPSPWRPIAPEVLQHVDTLLLNAQEAGALFGVSPGALAPQRAWPDQALRWRRAHPGIDLLVTLGDAGCLVWPSQADLPQHRPAHPVQAVDTTGCGDAFAAAWCRALACDQEQETALQAALAAGAWVAARRGVLDALPTHEALQAWLAQAP
ncbi:MAG: PfkB family carbohydrate kinase [Pseudomonadota bacterium]